MKKKALVFSSLLLLSFPSGYVTGYAMTEGEKLLFDAVYKLVRKYYELELKVKELERRLRELERKRTELSPYVSEGISEKYVVLASRLRVRKCPSFKCSVTGYLKRDEVVEKLDEFGAWFKVRKVEGGKRGWVHSKYLAPY